MRSDEAANQSPQAVCMDVVMAFYQRLMDMVILVVVRMARMMVGHVQYLFAKHSKRPGLK